MKKLGSKDRRRLKKERLASKNHVRNPKKDKPKKSHYSGKIYDEELYCIEGVRKIGKLVFRFIAVYLAGILGIFETLANIGNTFQETVIFFVKSWLSNGAAIGIIYSTIVCYIMPFFLSRRIYLDFDHRENSFIHILMRNYKMDELKGIIVDKRKGMGRLVKFYRKEDNKYIGCLFTQSYKTQINDIISALILYDGILENKEVYRGEVRTDHFYDRDKEDWA